MGSFGSSIPPAPAPAPGPAQVSKKKRKALFVDHRLGEADKSISEVTMISVLAQERLLGAALGCIFTGAIVFEHRKSIYESISENHSHLPRKSQIKEPIFGSHFRSDFSHLWNKAVDQTFRPVIEALSSRGL